MSTPSQRRFDQLFEVPFQRRQELAPRLRALADEMPSGSSRREIQKLIAELEKARSSLDLATSAIAMRWLPLLTTGFSSESSSQHLGELIAHASRESHNRRLRRLLLAYPLVLVVVACAVFVLLCVLVVPTFASMFEDFALQVPAPTRIIIFLAEQFSQQPIRAVVIIGVITACLYGFARLWVHFALTTRLLGTLVAGNSASLGAMSSLTGQMSELLSMGVSLADAFWIAGQGCRHYQLRTVSQHLARYVHRDGGLLCESPDARFLPANVIYALQPGPDQSPNLGLLRELSVIYGERAGRRVDWSSGAMAQLAILIVGIAVAFLIVSLFLPLFSLVTALS